MLKLHTVRKRCLQNRLNIQRAQSAVLTSPYTPPIAVGGSASAKKVALGGKLGIVKDPFGKLGEPQFMGATLPLDGYGIINLSLSKDGKVLIGQLKGAFSANIFDMQQKAHQSHAWNVEQLIAATLAHPDDKRLQKHIKLPNEAEQYITVPTNAAGYTAWPAGTMFNKAPLNVQYTGNMGDVIKVDLAELAAIKLLTEELNVSASALTKAQIDARKLLLKGFSLPPGVLEQIGLTAQRSGDPAAPRLLIATQGAAGSLVPLTDTGEKVFLETGVLYLVPNITNSRLPAASSLNGLDAKANRYSDIEKLRTGQTLADKFLSFGYGFTDTKYEKTKPGFERSGQATVTARDYATAPATFFGDRPLDNPGYGKMTLKGSVGEAQANNILDVLKVEQRLKYLGYGVSSIANSAEISVDANLSSSELINLRQFSQIVYGDTEYNDERETIVNAGNGKTKTVKVKVPAILSYSDTNWLNAYNAPHWMSYSGAMQTKLTGWVDKTTVDPKKAAGTEKMGTSWVFDLMLAAQDAAKVQTRTTPLWFAGAGSLGTRLNLGINTAYISQQNQDKVNGKDKVLGVVPEKPTSLITNPTAFNSKQWDYGNALGLAAYLRNPNISNVGHANVSANSSGENQQDQALLDFLSVFATTQSAGNDPAKPNGYWNGIAITNQSANDTIKKALFGDGTQAGGLINSSNVLIGGMGAPLGSQLTAESLAAFMKNAVRPGVDVNYAEWIDPLKQAMLEFDITTPQRIAAFLAQVKVESGGMGKTREEMIYWDNASVSINSLLNSAPQSALNVPYSAWRWQAGRTLDAYNATTRTPLENAKAWFRDVIVAGIYGIDVNNLTPAILNTKVTWNEAAKEALANRVYSKDKGNGGDGSNGSEALGDGYKYIGHGLKQVTGKGNTNAFASYVELNGNKVGQSSQAALALAAQIRATPDLIATDKSLAARSAAHFWFTNVSKIPSSGASTGRTLTQESELLNWQSPIPKGDEATFNSISRGIATAANSFNQRWKNYQAIATKALAGGNPYEDMQLALMKLGIQSFNDKGYETQFGIVLNKHVAVPVANQPRNLSAGQSNQFSVSQLQTLEAIQSQLPQPVESLLSRVQLDFDLHHGESIMWQIEPPSVPNQVENTILVAQANLTDIASKKSSVRAMGICIYAYANVGEGSIVQIWPESDAGSYMWRYEKQDGVFSGDSKVVLLQRPRHGELNKALTEYYPDQDFLGKDVFIVQVEKNGVKVNIHHHMLVSNGPENVAYGLYGKHCGVTGHWKISSTTFDQGTQDYTAWLRSSELSSLIATASQSLTGFTDLPGSSVGQTTGEGASAAITLDTTASGHGWYVDPTPLDNTDDYLPTSNPDIWQAKAGTEAASKMDLLSVLLHEYGHALGLDHSADAGDFMASTLQPGERRLPSAEELALMSQLVAQLKASMDAADASGNAAAGSIPAPTNPPSPQAPQLPPGTPVPAGLGLAAYLAGRQRRSGSTSSDALSATPQYEVLANPTLTNRQFTNAQGWATAGDVSISSGAATLAEAATQQTRLNQAFVMGTNDRVLSFTLSGIALDDASNAPDDAFEVALIDANTGLSLLGSTGLTHNDAFLNLQADGTQHQAAGVTTVKNADGSRTVRVDLSGIAAGTVLNLSFDLIGFGQGGAAHTANTKYA